MSKEELLEKLLFSYKQSFDIDTPYTIGDYEYDAHAYFNVRGSKYVLSKKAELWSVRCYEHVFFKTFDTLTTQNLENFAQQVEAVIEPELVRHGEKVPPSNHMYTFITGIFICDKTPSDEVERWLKKYKFLKNYRLTLRGYCETRITAFDLESNKVFGNPAAREIVKEYKKFF